MAICDGAPQIDLAADEKSHSRINHRAFATERSQMRDYYEGNLT